MAMKPKKPCNKIGCRNLTQGRFCEEHEYLAEQQRKNRHKRYDDQVRDKEADAFYHSAAWSLVRSQALARDHGLCVRCLKDQRVTPADMVDHIKPVRKYWHLRLELDNLQSLCNRCHAIKTVEDRRG